MMTAPHMVVGAAIGNMDRRLWLVLPIAFLSHFVLDFIPHVESEILYAGRPHWVMVLVAIMSTCLGIGLVIWACYRKPNWKIMYAGALVAVLPDLAEKVIGAARLSEWPATAWLYSFHHTFHHPIVHSGWQIGVATQVAVLAIALWAARRMRHG